jgi:hypothetical protein
MSAGRVSRNRRVALLQVWQASFFLFPFPFFLTVTRRVSDSRCQTRCVVHETLVCVCTLVCSRSSVRLPGLFPRFLVASYSLFPCFVPRVLHTESTSFRPVFPRPIQTRLFRIKQQRPVNFHAVFWLKDIVLRSRQHSPVERP